MLEAKQALANKLADAEARGILHPEGVVRLPLEVIQEVPELFQHRRPLKHISRQHVETLAGAAKGKKALPALLIYWAGGWVLLDGHHRMAAYRKAGWRRDVPVTIFRGTLDEAIGRACRDNQRDHLSMTNGERMSAAWRMVCSTKLTGEKISDWAGVSMRSVATMREELRKLLTMGNTLDQLSAMTWNLARSTAKGEAPDETDWDEKDEKDARDLADQLSKIFGKRLHQKHQVIAMALEAYDSRLPNTLRELWDTERGRIAPEDDDEELEF